MARKSNSPANNTESDGLLGFVRLPAFDSRWEKAGLTEEDFRQLELEIMRAPRLAPVVPGTNGLRKLRFAPPSQNRGKSGAYRAFYVYFTASETVVAVTMLSKGEAENLTRQQINEIGKLIPLLEADILALYGKALGSSKEKER